MSSNLNLTKENSHIITHLVIALCCLPVYQYGGGVLKTLIAPYVLYLLFSLQPRFIPALLLHFMAGTTMSFVILLGCLFISIKYFKKLKYYKVGLLFFITLIPLPFFLIVIYFKITIYNESIISLVHFLFLYFGLFSFFYFLLLAGKFTTNHLKYIFITLAISVVLSLFYSNTIRYNFYSLPIFFGLLLISLMHIKLFYKAKKLVLGHSGMFQLLFGVFLIIGIIASHGMTSTLLFTSLITGLISIYYLKIKKLSLRIPYLLFVLTAFIVLNAIQTYNPKTLQVIDYKISEEKLDILDLTSIINRSKFKLFVDRMPIWYSIYDNYVINGDYAIPIAPKKAWVYYSIHGTENDSTIPAHNIFLELIKEYGILTGLILSIVYILMIIKSSLLLKLKGLNIYLITISSCTISCAFFGGMTGQYLLHGDFSFLFMGLAGLCYGFFYNSKLTTAYVNENTI